MFKDKFFHSLSVCVFLSIQNYQYYGQDDDDDNDNDDDCENLSKIYHFQVKDKAKNISIF